MATNKDEQARFEAIFSVKSAKASADGKPRVTATASSDQPDLAGDIMSRRVLDQLCDAFARGMTVFLNHSYKIPDDVFGRIVSAEIVRRGEYNDLDVTIEVDTSNPRAAVTLDQITGGLTLGVSIGVLVKDAKQVTRNGQRYVEITDVTPLECSVVGIPANRRSWVGDALKAASAVMLQRSEQPKIDAGDALTALRTLVSLQRVQIDLLNREVARRDDALAELGEATNRLLNTPVGRKIGNAAEFSDIATRYPWLDERIVNALADDRHPTGAWP
jgi:phage head maturation protease